MSQAYAILTAAHVHTNTVKHNFKVDKNTTLLLWSSLSLPCIPWTWGVYGRTRGWQRSVVTSLSLTGSVLNHNHTITTRRPGARWARHYPGHNTNITPALSLYIYAQGASSGVWAVKVYFWMYSLHSERVAVGARQLWRQRVIVARQPDRPKMAELTGTGEQARFTLALTSLWQSFVSFCRPHQRTLWWLFIPLQPSCTATVCWWMTKTSQSEHRRAERRQRQREIRGWESESLCLFRWN